MATNNNIEENYVCEPYFGALFDFNLSNISFWADLQLLGRARTAAQNEMLLRLKSNKAPK